MRHCSVRRLDARFCFSSVSMTDSVGMAFCTCLRRAWAWIRMTASLRVRSSSICFAAPALSTFFFGPA